MKKLINAIDALVPQMLAGVATLHPEIVLLQGHTVALRADADALRQRGEVALISGGGAGHEPAHAGYIGPGLLTAAVVGDVFTSPSTDAVLAAIDAVAGPAGVLLIVKNYTGDRLNFGLAAEIARSRGRLVDMVVVADDAALAARGDHAGRRGIAGTVLVHKVAGAAAASGLSLAQVRQQALDAIAAVSTMGVALTPCTVPAAGSPSFTLGADEIELGLGIHGEPGVERAPLATADALVERMLRTLVADQSLQRGDHVALLVNNLGATPAQELSIVAGAAMQQLAAQGLVVDRAWNGTFLTALEMGGVSLSLLKLDSALLSALDAPAQAPAWPATSGRVAAAAPRAAAPSTAVDTVAPAGTLAATHAARPIADAMRAVADALALAEVELTRMDQVVGDGDLGISLARGAKALRAELPGYPQDDLAGSLRALSATLRRALGGTSGPLYAIGLMRAAAALEQAPRDGAAALRAAADGIMEVGGARLGDRTMLDALIPAAEAWQGLPADTGLPAALACAARAADKGCAATADILARRGRASYLGERARGHADPGARAIAIWLAALADHAAKARP